jgi:hypothetical protein
LLAVVFPAIVTSAGTNLTRAKVFIAADQAWVGLDSASGPQLVETIEISSLAVLGTGSYELTEPDGSVVKIRSGGGCGCGSKLRNWSPFSGPLRLGT